MAEVLSFPAFGGNTLGKKTQTAGTVINRLVPGRKNAITRITKIVYTAAATAHTITVMRVLGSTTLSAAAAASQAVINLVADPGPSGNGIAANDYLAIENDDGTVFLDTVSSVSSLAITMTTNLVTALSAGAKVWFFGVAANTDPKLLEAHMTLTGTASVTTTYSESVVGVFASHEEYEPILVQSNNASNAGTIEQVSYIHTGR